MATASPAKEPTRFKPNPLVEGVLLHRLLHGLKLIQREARGCLVKDRAHLRRDGNVAARLHYKLTTVSNSA